MQLQGAMGNEQIPNSLRRNYCVESLINSFTPHASTTPKQGKVHYRHSDSRRKSMHWILNVKLCQINEQKYCLTLRELLQSLAKK